MNARNARKQRNGASTLRQRLRQRRFPPEFRIPLEYPPPERAEVAPAGVAPAGMAPAGIAPAAAPQPAASQARQQDPQGPLDTLDPLDTPDPLDPPDSAMADLATSLWRLDRKLADGEQSGPGQRKAARHLRAARDALAKAGVETQDHDGMEFDLGLSLDVLAYQPTPGATRQTVLETIRPSVFRGGRSIQIGQVIVARPEGDHDHDA